MCIYEMENEYDTHLIEFNEDLVSPGIRLGCCSYVCWHKEPGITRHWSLLHFTKYYSPCYARQFPPYPSRSCTYVKGNSGHTSIHRIISVRQYVESYFKIQFTRRRLPHVVDRLAIQKLYQECLSIPHSSSPEYGWKYIAFKASGNLISSLSHDIIHK